MKTYDYSKVELTNPRVQAVINAGYEEFSKTGYKKASTNHIAANAGVARGLIYYYFGDKQGLFQFLMDNAVDRIMCAMEEGVDWSNPDLLYRITKTIFFKCRVLADNPKIFDFLLVNMEHYRQENINPFFKGGATDIKKLMHDFYYSEVDESLFKEGLDVEKTINTIRWTIERLGMDWTEKAQARGGQIDLKALYAEVDAYVDYLRKIFYK